MTSEQINFGTEEGTIGGPNIRAVIIVGDRILLQKQMNEDVWITPGGGPLFGETTKDAIKRHILRKCGFKIGVERSLWISEIFYFDVGHDRNIHGIGFYYLVSPKKSESIWQQEEFQGINPQDLFYKWFKLDELSEINLKPDCLKQLLKEIPRNPVHVVCRED
ncbi:MAG: NUDIX hydrolase [Candidatus Thorarchaeota archaeon]